MVRWVVGSIFHGGAIELFLVPASVLHIQDPLPLNEKSNPRNKGSEFSLIRVVRSHITGNKNVLSASLNNHFLPSM